MARKKLRDIVVKGQTWKWYVKENNNCNLGRELVIFDPQKRRYSECAVIEAVTPGEVENKILMIMYRSEVAQR